jgi:cysteinyl-tRNA synthetase
LKSTLRCFVTDVLGLTNQEIHKKDSLDVAMNVLIELRNKARLEKNWKLSDEIRDELSKNGIILKDGKDGTSYNII